MADIVCLGEALIDLIPTVNGAGLMEATTFIKAAGGAPANVAAGIAKLGGTSRFLGMVGDDGFGRFLAETLAAAGVDVDGLHFTRAAPTALAAVSLTAEADRDFVFYGNPPAHALLAPEDIDEALIRDAKILHFGSLTMIDEPACAATLHAVDLAHLYCGHVSFDPNLRLSLWPNVEVARAGIMRGLAEADIVKMSEEEVAFLAPGACDTIEGARSLWHPRLSLMVVTRGARGSLWLDPQTEGVEPGFEVAAVDATGAGDAFMAALLVGLVSRGDRVDHGDTLGHTVRFANAAGALATTKRGAIPALPDRAAVEHLLGASRRLPQRDLN